ncbi:hypothetical protein GCM10007874_70710 [Labrys miyagiensis]|uniref:Uncharacterized protein n=1 Tax=Labrys miyagiensis TaxID=346912 RepID=A0ABQ6CVA8_9HYPH|nr:hypothetical protein GCM10007874_70710 [Labrys miyagiensis]
MPEALMFAPSGAAPNNPRLRRGRPDWGFAPGSAASIIAASAKGGAERHAATSATGIPSVGN